MKNNASMAALPYESSVRIYNNRPDIYINDHLVSPIIYGLSDIPASRSYEGQAQHNIANFGQAGINMVQVDTAIHYGWKKDQPYDMSEICREVAGATVANPNAAVIIRLHLNPPHWWMAEHPEELTVYGDCESVDSCDPDRLIAGDLNGTIRVSLASERWRREAGNILAQICRELPDTAEGRHVIGIQPACGVFGEWHQWGFFEHDPDYSPCMTRAYRRYLRHKYGTDDALRQAWNDPAAAVATAVLPGMEQRNEMMNGMFRDPIVGRPTVDSLKALQLAGPETILHFCRIIKQTWPRPILTGVLYGYFFNVGSRAPIGGHLEPWTLLDSPYLDYFSAPFMYQPANRNPGGLGHSRGLLESIRLHGKLWLTEMDQAPFGTEKFKGGDPTQHRDSSAIMLRNTMEPFMHGMGFWFYDHRLVPSGSIYHKDGWWDNPALMNTIRKIKAVYDEKQKDPFVPAADVTVVYDTESCYHMALDGKINMLFDIDVEYASLDAVGHAGAAYECMYLHDIEKVDWNSKRVVIFYNACYVPKSKRDFIKEKIARGGRHLVWIYASGYSDGEGLSERLITELTGIGVEKCPTPQTVITFGNALPAGQCESPGEWTPLFQVNDSAAETQGTFSNGGVAAAKKQLSDSTAWFFSLPISSREIFRAIFRLAGAHLYSTAGEALNAGNGIITIHCINGGQAKIVLCNGTPVTFDAAAGETLVLDAETGDLLDGTHREFATPQIENRN